MRIPALLAVLLLLGGCASRPGTGAIDAPLVDYHQHLVSPAFAPIAKVAPLDGAELVRRLDAAGVRRAVVLSVGYSFADERKGLPDPDRLTREENDWTSGQVAASGGRLVGFCGVNPLRDAALSELDRCLALPGMRGIKLHLGNSGVSLRDAQGLARTQAVFALAERRRAPVLVHMRYRGGKDYGAPDAQIFLDQVVARTPKVEVVVAHFGGSGPGYPEQADEVMAVFAAAAERRDPRLRNLYFDVATIVAPDSPVEEGARIAARVRQIGPSHVLYGSDLLSPGSPTIAQAWSLFKGRTGLSPAEIRVISANRPSFMR